MHENVVGQAILRPQRRAIEPRVGPVSHACIHVVNREDDLLSQPLVIERQQRAIERVELVVPEDVENLRDGRGRITQQPAVVDQNSPDLAEKAGVRRLIASEIEEPHARRAAKIRAVQLVARDDIEADALRQEGGRQTEGVGSVAPAGQQGNLKLVGCHSDSGHLSERLFGALREGLPSRIHRRPRLQPGDLENLRPPIRPVVPPQRASRVAAADRLNTVRLARQARDFWPRFPDKHVSVVFA